MNNKVKAISILYSSIFGFIGLIGLIFKEDFRYYFGFESRLVFLFSIFSLLFSISFILMLYVRGYILIDKKNEIEYDRSDDIENIIETIVNDRLKSINNDQNLDIRNLVKNEINKISEDHLSDIIIQKFNKEFEEESKLKRIEFELIKTRERIFFETSKITRYSYINLMIGFITTFSAITILGLTLISEKPHTEDLNSYLFFILPRISLSILIEIFSFFFLRLYKNNLDDIKYLNNEKTNIDFKIISLKTALLLNNKDCIDFVIKEFATTERNFVLKEKETTVEIEKAKIQSNNESNLLSTLSELLKKANGSS